MGTTEYAMASIVTTLSLHPRLNFFHFSQMLLIKRRAKRRSFYSVANTLKNLM